MNSLKNKKIILGVGGGIAAYKACDLVRRFMDLGADVHVILTAAGQKFVTPLTLQSLSQHPVHTDLFDLTEESEMSHIKLADEADLVLIAPATADLLAKAACGIANDLLTTVLLVTKAPVFVAPSMNVNMWEKDIVQKNLRILQERGYRIIDPEEGSLACGWEGKGRLADPEGIVQFVVDHLSLRQVPGKKKSLQGKKILINAGPTREFLDPVRFISNPSTGKMGFALAAEAQARGARVTLVSGPVHLATPQGVERIDVSSTNEMLKACERKFPFSDIFIANAAVGDFLPKKKSSEKIKKAKNPLTLTLIQTPDILARLGKLKKKNQIVVGFAAETKDLLKNAREKLKTKNLDLIVVNDVSKEGIGFSSDQNEVTLLDRKGKIKKLGKAPKTQIASQVLDGVEGLGK